MKVVLLQPAVVFRARVNQASFSYPLADITYDGVTVGNPSAVQPGMTVVFGSSAGGDDLGRQRVRRGPTADTLYIGRSSRGSRDGEVDLADNAHVTVLDDYRVWAKISYIAADGTVYKDADLEVGTNTTTPPPVANAGAPTAGTIDRTTGKLRVQLPHGSNTSFAVAGTIASYSWTLPAGVTLLEGYNLDDPQIQVDCAPGFHWVALTVFDSNSKSHTARVPIFARDPAEDLCIGSCTIESHRITPQGQQISLRVLESIPEGSYPDGTLVMLWEGEPAGPADRSHLVFWGWHHNDPASIAASRTGILRGVTLECLDVAGKLDRLPGFTQSVEGKASPASWLEMASPNMDKYLHYLLHWHSTALEVADWTWTGTGAAFPFVVLGSDGASLFDQVEQRARALVPDYHLTCNRLGQLRMPVDPLLQDIAQRTATVQATLGEADWSEVRYARQRPGRYHWHRGNAVLASATEIAAIFCVAPGDAPAQGELAQEQGEQLARSQADLNACEGHRYARANAPETPFTITLAGGDDRGIEPADYTWVQLTISSSTAAQRGLAFTEARGLPLELNIRYDQRREGLARTVGLLWERETAGPPAVTYTVPVSDDPGGHGGGGMFPPPDWDLPEFDFGFDWFPSWGAVGAVTRAAVYVQSGAVETDAAASPIFIVPAGMVLRLKAAVARLGTAGTSSTSVRLLLNGQLIATLSFGAGGCTASQAVIDPSTGQDYLLTGGDYLSVQVTAAGAGAMGLCLLAVMRG